MLFRRNHPNIQPSFWRQLKEKMGSVSDMAAGETPTFRKLFLWPSATILATLVLTAASRWIALFVPEHRTVYVLLPFIFAGTGIVALLTLLLRLRDNASSGKNE